MAKQRVWPQALRIYHYAVGWREDGAVTAACYSRPRTIDLRRATWTIREEAVTCPKCKRVLAERDSSA